MLTYIVIQYDGSNAPVAARAIGADETPTVALEETVRDPDPRAARVCLRLRTSEAERTADGMIFSGSSRVLQSRPVRARRRELLQ